MITSMSSQIERRLHSLEKHLKQENPVLLQVVQSFRDLDRVAYRMGILSKDESFATRVPWWPLISILGTFSAGKSSFINSYLGYKLQRTGNQAVDDKFTVMCFSKEDKSHTLPGMALDADPRFPFYQISRSIDAEVEGEGRRIDAYLQLKTAASEELRGKIIIDSPGFDADAQRTATLRITDHIMNLSDLVLVFFDARHPEPGAMKDTLDHLVSKTIARADSNKFLFILNQVDCTASEDNLEDVVAAWQRSLSQSGLTAGRFYQIYNKDSCVPIDDDNIRIRYEAKREEDMDALMERIDRVEVERAYRIISVLEHTAKVIPDVVVPKVSGLLKRWRKMTMISDAVVYATLMIAAGVIFYNSGYSVDQVVKHLSQSFKMPADGGLPGLSWWIHAGGVVTGATVLLYLHLSIRKLTARIVGKDLPKDFKDDEELMAMVQNCFKANTSGLSSVFSTNPNGWSGGTRRKIKKVLKDTDMFVQNLNDQFTNPSGKVGGKNPKVMAELPSSNK